LKATDIISEKTNAKNTPTEMNIWLKLVIVPDISFGESYFIINGAVELNIPAHIP